MKRRTAAVWIATSFIGGANVRAQAMPRKRPWRIGMLSSTDPETTKVTFDRLTIQLRALGYAPGRDFTFEARYSWRDAGRLPQLARELVAARPDVLIALDPAIAALKEATSLIPIVMIGALNPVETGLIASVTHPGGNITGTTYSQTEIGAKRLEVMKMATPHIRRIAYVQNPDVPGMLHYRRPAEDRAAELGLELHYVEVRRADEFPRGALDRVRPDALYVTYDAVVGSIMPQLAQYAREHRIPSAGAIPEFVRVGGLMFFGPDSAEIDATVAGYIDRILHGTSPAEMAIWMPSRFKLLINRSTAARIGLVLSPELLLRADEIVD